MQLTDGASALQNDSLRRAIVSDVFDRARMVAEPTHVTSHLSGQTLTISYRDPGAAETHDDTIVFTRFHATGPQSPFVIGGEGTPYPGADTVMLRAPNGYTVTGDYAPATESETAVWWHGNGTTEHIDRSTRVTFIDDQSPQPDSNDATPMAGPSDVWNSLYRTPVAALCGFHRWHLVCIPIQTHSGLRRSVVRRSHCCRRGLVVAKCRRSTV